jgi:ketosteroid isomerase-like protein
MHRLVAILLLSLTAVSLTFGASDKKKKSERSGLNADEQAITKLEEEWAAALVKKDFTVIDRVTAPDWTLTAPDGQMQTKAQTDADLKSGVLKFESVKFSDLKFKIYGDTAVVFGISKEKVSYKGEDMSGEYRFTDVFVKKNGNWQCVATHVTKIAAKPKP